MSTFGEEMVDSVFLPDVHANPFDSLLIAQVRYNNFLIVTKDKHINAYGVETILQVI